MKRYFCLIASAMLFLFLYTGCGSSGGSGAVAAPEQEAMSMDTMSSDRLASNGEPKKTKLPDNRKWVITSEVRAETDNMDKALSGVLEQAAELKGYVEDQNFENGSYYNDYDRQRSARLTIRIPAENIDAFMAAVEEKTNVVSSSRNLQDITLQYSDTETRIAALEKEEARLLEFMDQADTMADLLEIERRLTEVHYELENVNSRLRTYDNQVNYATIHLTLEEVREYTPVEEPSFLERITTGFVASLKGVGRGLVDFVVFLIVASPYLVVWGVIILVIVLIVRACTRKKGKKQKKAVGVKKAAGPQEIPEAWKNFQAPEQKEPKEDKPQNEEKK